MEVMLGFLDEYNGILRVYKIARATALWTGAWYPKVQQPAQGVSTSISPTRVLAPAGSGAWRHELIR